MSPLLSGATPIRSSDLSKPSDQIAARWPLPSEVFAPVALIPERNPSALTTPKIFERMENRPRN
jgi:hypothetical protein